MESTVKRTKTIDLVTEKDAETFYNDMSFAFQAANHLPNAPKSPELIQDLWFMILTRYNLTGRSILALCGVNKMFQRLCKDSRVWLQLIQRKYGQREATFLSSLFVDANITLDHVMAYESWATNKLTTNFVYATFQTVAVVDEYHILSLSCIKNSLRLVIPKLGKTDRIVNDEIQRIIKDREKTTTAHDLSNYIYMINMRDMDDAKSLFIQLAFTILNDGYQNDSAKNAALNTNCASCLQNTATVQCIGCQNIAYCDESCAKRHWVSTHQYECFN